MLFNLDADTVVDTAGGARIHYNNDSSKIEFTNPIGSYYVEVSDPDRVSFTKVQAAAVG